MLDNLQLERSMHKSCGKLIPQNIYYLKRWELFFCNVSLKVAIDNLNVYCDVLDTWHRLFYWIN